LARRTKTQPPEGGPAKVPGPEDFTRKAIYRAVLKDTLQHPLTLFPAVASALGGLYMGLFGLAPASLAVAFGGALAGAGAWVFNYFIRGETLAEQRVAKLRARRERYRDAQVATLEAEWRAAGLAEGEQQARELREAYQKLEQLLDGRSGAADGQARIADRGLNAQRLRVLAEDTYREGVAILRSALDTWRALSQVDREKLQAELAAWQEELRTVRLAAVEPARVASLETRIASHQRRLQLYHERVESIDHLFAESEALESALESTYLEAVDLKGAGELLGQGQAASALERAVTAARRVEDRLRAMEAPSKDDEVYLAAGERSE
jgi:hypothetical protein